MSARIRFAILSFAHYHATFWADAINHAPDAELVGIWDDDPGRGEEAAAAYGARFEPHLDRLLAACDAVGITSETSKHADLVEAAAAAGKHILKDIIESSGNSPQISPLQSGNHTGSIRPAAYLCAVDAGEEHRRRNEKVGFADDDLTGRKRRKRS